MLILVVDLFVQSKYSMMKRMPTIEGGNQKKKNLKILRNQ